MTPKITPTVIGQATPPSFEKESPKEDLSTSPSASDTIDQYVAIIADSREPIWKRTASIFMLPLHILSSIGGCGARSGLDSPANGGTVAGMPNFSTDGPTTDVDAGVNADASDGSMPDAEAGMDVAPDAIDSPMTDVDAGVDAEADAKVDVSDGSVLDVEAEADAAPKVCHEGDDLQITTDPGTSLFPSPVWTGSEYGLAWADSRDGNGEIYFRRLAADGSFIGPEIRETNNAANSNHPQLVWNGADFGMAWVDTRDGRDVIYFKHLDAQGNALSGDLPIPTGSGKSSSPSLIWTGTEFALAWQDTRDGNEEIYFARLDAQGNPLTGDIRVTNDPASSQGASLVQVGANYAIAWADQRVGSNFEIYYTLIDGQGSKIVPDRVIPDDSNFSSDAALAWTGAEYGLTWRTADGQPTTQHIYFTRLDTLGIPLGAMLTVVVDPYYVSRPSFVWNGLEYALSWTGEQDGNDEIYVTRLDAQGKTIDFTRVTNDFAGSYEPVLAANNSGYAVAWRDQRAGSADIFFDRLLCP